MNSRSDITDRVIRLMTELLHQEVSEKPVDFVDENLLDSMLFVDLVMNLEKEFGISIEIDDLEVDTFRTVNKITEFVMTLRGTSEFNSDSITGSGSVVKE